MSYARVSGKSDEEKDLLTRSTKKPKGGASDFSAASSTPVSYDDVGEEPQMNNAAPLKKTFVHALEGRSSSHGGTNRVHPRHEEGSHNMHEHEVFESGDMTGISVVEKMLGKYECPEFLLDEKEKERIRRPWKQGLIVKMLGRKIGYKALENRLKQLWVRRGVIDIIDLGYDYFLVKFSNEEDLNEAIVGGPWLLYDHYLTIR
ncbi:hypothetical protein RIF29_33302 [Crotalaria pallida]|uniref:DUF4283 domain-containing protein n=1 Tax=Crotalaria pallida TaxID=3830 RepID=A0AAN9HTZ9_CROPI